MKSGSTAPEARATVNFWKDTEKSENRATVYVKNSDTADELVKIIYDPGVGTLESGQVFLGWTDDPDYTADTTPKTVATIRSEMEAKAITEGDVVDYYAMIFQIYNIAFQDEYGSTVNTDKLFVRADGENPDYTINEDYVPADPNKKFMGWYVQSGTVEPDQDLYEVGTEVKIGSDVVFTVNAPTGAWLSFNENGKGASYTAPQFVESGAVTTRPADPTRKGYTFAGWYTGAPATEGGDPTGTVFEFGKALTTRTDIYAKWVPVTTAPYTVIIWKQCASDDKNAADADKTYDVGEVITLNGSVGSTVNTITQPNSNTKVDTGRGNSVRNYSVNGSQKSYPGFHASRYDNATIQAEGTTVVNVYYDRNLIALTFTTGNGPYRNYYFDVGNGRVRSATMTGLFDAEIDFSWPSVGYANSTTTNTTPVLWSSQRYSGNLTFYGSYKLRGESDVNDTYTMTAGGNGTVYFYRQNSDGTWPADAQASNVAYITSNNASFTLTNKYAGFSLYKYKSGSFVAADNTQWSNARPEQTVYLSNGRLNIRFTRDKYPITYLDGTYFDGNGTVLQAATRAPLDTSEEIYYEADISSYGEGGDDYYTPDAVSGYTFSGWYLDETCTKPATFTTMPQGGIIVYAKWVQTQYRVFLHPNVPETETLEWGQTGQQMNFRVTTGEKISGGNVVNGDRAGRTYELIGWFRDPSLSNSSYFNFDTVLNDTTVSTTPAYNKSTDYTDTMNKYGRITDYGSNSDVERPWITRKLDLYAKWRSILPGAKGINVVYDPTEDGHGEPNDTQNYLDNSEAIAQGASVPNDTTKQFKGWKLQTWNGSEYVDKSGAILNPGDPFTVLKADAKQEPRLDDEGNPMVDENSQPQYIYTVKLVAVYDEFEAPDPTHISWYSNVQTVDGTNLTINKFTHPTATESEDGKGWFVTDKYDEDGELDLQINEAIDIRPADTYSYPGLKFLGWAKSKDATADDLFLKYEDGVFKAKDSTDAWVTVTQVAADERTPYDDLYAVWEEQYFYVYHSSDGTVEKISLGGVETYNITSKVKGDYIYGGYYKDYAKKGSYDIANPAEYTSAVSGSKAYVGGLGYWKAANAYTENGTAMKPEANMTYFLKEVPAGFLASKLYVIYDAHNDNTVVQNYLISDVDDNNYNEVSLYAKDISTGDRIKLAASYTINDTYNNKTDKITAKTTFGMQAGYVAVWKPDLATADFEFAAGFKTPDGVDVEGAYIRMVTVGDGKYKGNFNSGNGGFAIVDVKNGHIITPGQIVG